MTYTFDGYRVSAAWFAALTAARRDGVRFHVNSGQRTMAEQTALYAKYHGKRPVAWPTPWAPHIRVGSQLHAIDVENGDGGADRLVGYLHNHGVNVTRPVGGEPWHIDPLGTNLVGRFPLVRDLGGGMRGKDVKALVTNLMWLGYLPWPVLGRPRSYFGGWVNTAVKHFQRDHNLTPDGVVGERTRTVLKGTLAARKRAGWKPKRRPPLLLPKRPKPAPKHAARGISAHGVAFIASFEGYYPNWYLDPVGVRTIGYGHTSEGLPSWAKPPLSKGTAMRLLKHDLAAYENTVRSAVKVPLTQNQHDALTSFVYNVGAGAFRDSTLLRKLNQRDYRGAANEFKRWNKGGGRVLPGLTRRRAAEAALFRT